MRGLRGLGAYGGALALIHGAGVAGAAEPVVVVALGDSLTAGYGLPADEGFVPQLQAWLDAHGGGVEVRNAGVSGDTTAGGLARVGWALGDDADAVIVALGGNDLLRGIDPAESEANLRGILEAVGERPALVVGIDAGPQYGDSYEAAFDGMFPALGEEFGALVEPDFFAALRGEDPGAVLQPDGIHPSAEGVARIIERMGPRVRELAARVSG